MKNYKLLNYIILLLLIGGAIFGKCNKRKSTTTYTLKISKALGATSTDTVTATWSGGTATDEQLATGVKINMGTSITLKAHSTKSNITWNKGTTSGTTFTFTINKDTTIIVAFAASSYALSLNANAGYTIQAYTNQNLTDAVADLTKITPNQTIYIRVPKTNIDNKTVTVIGADSFSDTTAIVKMTEDKTITATYALDTSSFTYGKILGTNEYAVSKYSGIYNNVEIPAKINGLPVTVIGRFTVVGIFSSSVKSVIIPEGVTTIGRYAFNDCTSLTQLTIPNSITTIEQNAFWGCSALAHVDIPNGVTSIATGAFSQCSALNNVIIPASVDTIEAGAFWNCSSLSNIKVESPTPCGIGSDYGSGVVQYSIFASGDPAPDLTIAVPRSTNSTVLNAYKAAWTDIKLLYSVDKNNQPIPSSRKAVIWTEY